MDRQIYRDSQLVRSVAHCVGDLSSRALGQDRQVSAQCVTGGKHAERGLAAAFGAQNF